MTVAVMIMTITLSGNSFDLFIGGVFASMEACESFKKRMEADNPHNSKYRCVMCEVTP